MLPAKNRLTKKENFQKAIRQGAFFSLGNIALKAAKNSLEITRIGFLVGKKSGKDAVRRNRIKRILRGAFLKNLEEICPGYDVVVFCNYLEKKKGRFEIEKNIARKLLEKSHLLKKTDIY